MFGVLASGKLVSVQCLYSFTNSQIILLVYCCTFAHPQVNTNVQQANPNTFLLAVDGADSINHIVVFLTGQVPFSDGYGGSIYLGWPSLANAGAANLDGISWQLLGFISNEKPSTIFKIAKAKPHEVVANPFTGASHMAMDMSSGSFASSSALVGVSVEPLTEIAQKTPSVDTTASTVGSFTEFSQKMLENFFNYASSFAASPEQILTQHQLRGGGANDSYIPFATLQQWYTNFQRRLQTNPDFWKSM